MIAILRSNDYTEGYKIVKVLKNPISKNNQLALIEMAGKEFWAGGILCEVHHTTLEVLGKLSNKEQFDWLKSIKNDIYQGGKL